MTRGEESFPKFARLRSGHEFRKVLREGRRLRTPAFTLYLSRENGTGCRLGLIVPRRIGNAVTRNRTKRILRELFRRSGSQIHPGIALVVRAAPGITTFRYQQLEREFGEALKKAGLLRNDESANKRSQRRRGPSPGDTEPGSKGNHNGFLAVSE